MIKRMLALLLAMIMVLGLSACKNEEVPDEPTVRIEPFEYTVSVRIVDDWRVDNEDGTREYYLTLFANSENMYDDIEKDDIIFYSEDGYNPLESTIANSEVTIVNLNEDTMTGIAAFIMIKTDPMIDSKKINISCSGPSTYDADCLDKESYEAKHGQGSWGAVMSKVSSSSYASSTVTKTQSGMRYGMLCPANGDGLSLALYFDQRNDADANAIVDGDKCYIELDVMSFSERDVASFNDYFESMMFPKSEPKIDEGTVELDENVTKYVEYVEGGKIRFGYQTADGSDIESYVESLPEWIAIVYSSGASYIKFK